MNRSEERKRGVQQRSKRVKSSSEPIAESPVETPPAEVRRAAPRCAASTKLATPSDLNHLCDIPTMTTEWDVVAVTSAQREQADAYVEELEERRRRHRAEDTGIGTDAYVDGIWLGLDGIDAWIH